KWIVSGSFDSTLKVWDAEMGEESRTLQGHTGFVRAVAVSPDGKWIVSGSKDETLKVWDAETGFLVDSIVCDGGPTSIALHGARIYVGCMNSTIAVYEYRP
ncbi:MAG: hypothetical protein HY720_09790, partial [Planctomycetes bacterium]|nr:hypothetical protein [Planctomycetota bacterium]